MKKFILVAFLIFYVSTVSAVEFRRAENTLDDVFAASCRVNVSGARGSGTFNGVKDGLAFISTNYHVVGGQANATVDFWTNGVKQTLNGRVAWKAYDANMPADFAFIVVDADELKRVVDPPYIALGGSDAKPSVNSFFLSSGGPKGWSVKAWKGKILDYYNGETVLFQPHPVPGQSGSGVFEEIDGELFQVGVITWLIGNEGDDAAKGGAIPISNLYKALKTHPWQIVAPNNENGGDKIPPGAVECLGFTVTSEADDGAGSGGAPQIVYFTSDNCPACASVAPEIETLKQKNYPVTTKNAGFYLDQLEAANYSVTETPTAIILDGTKKERARVTFDEMKKQGAAKAISTAYNRIVKEINEEARKSADNGDDVSACPLPETNAELNDDFRKRRAHYETPPNTGFFDDSEERWRARGRLPRNNDGDTGGEDKLDGETATRLADRLGKRVEGVIERQIDKAVARGSEQVAKELEERIGSALRGNVDGMIDNLQSGIQEKIETSAKGLLLKYARRCLLWAFVVVVLGQLIASFLKRVVVSSWSSLKEIAVALSEYNDAKRETKSAGKTASKR